MFKVYSGHIEEIYLSNNLSQPNLWYNCLQFQIMFKEKDSKQSIQVTIRVRPLSDKQKMEDPRVCVFLEQSHSLKVVNAGDAKKFTFDSICFEQSQQQMFERVGRRCTIDCLEGYNCTIFAYGQTGAGKTYTMMGVNSEHQNYEFHKGLIPRTMKYLFQCIQKERSQGVNFIIRCSFLEIYNQQIIDLLNKSNTNLQLREDTRKGVYVQGITQETVTRSEQVMDILNKGSKSRHVGSTFYNQTSSRSHSVFTMQIESRYSKNGVINTKSRQFNFIDLAGSQRTKQSTGQRLKQGCNINKSLMNLASVINALSEVSQGKSQHVNYRNSKLTFLLKDSLGGNSKTNLIANISPAAVFYQQTLSTLGFARRAKLIKRQKASINEDSSGNLQSMKNEIKRLKQQVITLMGRLQSGEQIENLNNKQPAPQMTTIMHEYVAEQIDKQTRLQMEILKLNQRIVYLQNGLKQYSANDTHLRMIIAVLEDKISRLKSVQNALRSKAGEIAEGEVEIKTVKEYFQNERLGLIKQLQSFKGQSEGTRIIKELLNQARVIREDSDQQQTLKQLLSKNTEFLTMIHKRLDEIRPQKQEIQCNAEFEKKLSMLELQYSKREQEQQERIEQVNLELNDARLRYEQNEKLLEEAISDHIVLEEKIKQAETEKEQLKKQMKVQEEKVKLLQDKMTKNEQKYEETIAQLKNELTNKNMEQNLLRKQIEGLKNKVQKLNTNELILKQQFEALQQQKYKIDKILMQNIEEIKQQKNTILKNESQLHKIQLALQNIINEKNQLYTQYQKAVEQLQAEKKKQKTKIEEIQTLHNKQIQNLNLSKVELQKELAIVEQKWKETEVQLSQQSEQLQILAKKYSEMEIGLKNQLTVKQNKMREVIQMMSKKEQNGNEIQFKLNQVQAQLINLTNEKEEQFNSLNKEIEELKEKINKQHTNAEVIQNQFNEKTVECDKLNDQLQLLKKQILGLKEEKNKISQIKVNLEDELRQTQTKYEMSKAQVQEIMQKEKQARNSLNQVNNQLFMTQKNKEIQVQALKSQLLLKQQHIDSVEKQHQKNKTKLERQILELREELAKTQQSYEQYQNSLKKSLESQLVAKQKKISQLKNNLSEKQEIIKKYESEIVQTTSQKDLLQVQKNNNMSTIRQLSQKVAELTVQLSQTKTINEQLLEKHEKEMEESQMIHNEQIDQKNQKIQSLMLENESLNKELLQIKELKAKDQEKLLQVRQSNAHLEAELATINSKYAEMTDISKNVKQSLENKNSEIILHKQNIQSLTCANNQILFKISSLQRQIEDKNQYVNKLSLQLQQTKRQLNTKEEENKSLKAVIVNVRNEAEVMKKQIEEAISDSKNLTQQIEQLKQENKQLKISHSQTIREMNETNYKNVNLKQDQINSLKTFNSGLQKRITQLEVEKSQNLEDINLLDKSVKDFESLYEAKIKLVQEQTSTIQGLKLQIKELYLDIQSKTQSYNELNHQFQQMRNQITQLILKNSQLSKRQQQISQELAKYQDQNQSLNSQLKYVQNIKDQINVLFQEMKQKSKKDSQRTGNQISNLKNQINNLINEINQLNQIINQKQNENNNLHEKITKLQTEAIQNLNQVNTFKMKSQTLQGQITKHKSTIEEQQRSKERLYAQVCRERQNNANFKLIIENSQAQIRQLQVELEQKDAIYKKLLEKIAKNQNQSKKTTNSEHYLKTIELLQKSRAEQLELRRQNQDLKKALTNMKQTLQQKQNYVREVEKKSEGYCISMHKRLEEIQRDYCELQKNQQKIIKEKKTWQKMSLQNEGLKQQIKKKQFAINKLLAKQQDVENRLKQCNLDYISLEKQFEQLKKSQIMSNNTDQKTNYINRLKAEVAALKTEKVLLTDSLNKEREEKTKLKSEIRFGKEDNSLSLKIDLEKKVNQNKNLQQLIFQIVSHLKICVNQPKTKLQAIRSVILGTIKEKFNQIKVLKEKIKQFEEGMQQTVKQSRQPAFRQFKALSLANPRNNNQGSTQDMFKFEKEKDPAIMDNLTRQRMRQLQNRYAHMRPTEQFTKHKNI